MPLVLKSSWMDSQKGTVDLRQEESLEAVITLLRFLFFETNYQQEIVCGERVVNGMPSVLLMKDCWCQPYMEDTLPTPAGWSVLLGTMSLKHGTAVQRACLMESMHVWLCVYIQTNGTATVMVVTGVVPFSVNQPIVQVVPLDPSCPVIKLEAGRSERTGGVASAN